MHFIDCWVYYLVGCFVWTCIVLFFVKIFGVDFSGHFLTVGYLGVIPYSIYRIVENKGGLSDRPSRKIRMLHGGFGPSPMPSGYILVIVVVSIIVVLANINF